MNFDADDLIAMWNFQDDVEKFSLELLNRGIELGVLSMAIELHKMSIQTGLSFPDEVVAKMSKISTARAKNEMKERLKNARGTK